MHPLAMTTTVLLFLLLACQPPQGQTPQQASEEKARTDETVQLRYSTPIRAIHHAQNGDLWIASHREGVCRFDGERFHYYTTEEGLPQNQVRTIQEDAEGNIWFGMDGVVAKWDGVHMQHMEPRLGPPTSSWKLSPSDMWFNAGTDFGAYRWNGAALHFLPLVSDTLEREFQGLQMTGYAMRQDGRVCFASYGGIAHFDGQQLDIINDAALGYTESEGYLHVRSIFEDSQGRLWIGNNGIGALVEEEGQFLRFSEAQGLIHAASTRSGGPSPPGTLEHVFAIAEDQAGNIWFGDRDTGAWRFDGKQMHNYTQEAGLTNLFVNAIHCDRDGTVWIGLGDGNVLTFNGTGFDQVFYQPGRP